ncbi:hypothetical protein TNIN_33891 [Trichonephila inaurata madagascariensis]|uniref:Uncharacterized protein n=1 Tax=Trichonephila inaurata madagascariensis TaxID=2747483 RepID=A0A8X6MIT7_9ARAC|nr:hypothetical protein TNIN_33891 [Trichonephila inaurata madagascariensis]
MGDFILKHRSWNPTGNTIGGVQLHEKLWILYHGSNRTHEDPGPRKRKTLHHRLCHLFWPEQHHCRIHVQFIEDLQATKEHAWDQILSEANSDSNAIHKITARNRKPAQIPPLLGHHGLAYSIQDKANLFMETLEESYKENATPCDDGHIDLVDLEVRRYFRNYRLQSPPLASPQEICEIILSLDSKKLLDLTKGKTSYLNPCR